MSDQYEINGVTVTPLGGGFYELKHTSITADGGIEKVRGKENADNRAIEIAAAAAPPEGHIQSQGSLDDALSPPVPPVNQPDDQPDAAADEIAALKAQLATAEQRAASAETVRDDLIAAAANAPAPTTVVATDADPVEGRVPGGIPTSFVGELPDTAKEALKRAGLGYTKIILEENSDIPPTGLFLGHNGRGYMIQPGEPVDVPDFVLGVLNDAKMSAPVVDNKTMKVLGYRERMKYPYRRVD